MLVQNKLLTDIYKPNTSTIDNGSGCQFLVNNQNYFTTCAYNRFYIAMSPLFTKSDLLTKLKNDLTSGPEIKNNQNAINAILTRCDQLAKDYTVLQDYWKNIFDKLPTPSDSGKQIYTECTTFKIPDNQVKKSNSVTPAVGDLNQKNKRIKDLYSNQNLNDKKDTFNGKVTLN